MRFGIGSVWQVSHFSLSFEWKNILIGLLSIFIVGNLLGDTTYVSGIIDTNTVWHQAGSPYVVIDHTEVIAQ